MICPACKEAMIVVEHEGIELDYCVACEGIWFDATELELLFESFNLGEDVSVEALMKLPARAIAEALRKCPLCSKEMRKVLIGTEPEVLIDSCANGDGLWFDGGELSQVIRQMVSAPGASGKVVSFLGETFGGNANKGESCEGPK